ncbi:MAG TPA: hypothetical protein VIY56_19235, partial [Vicinamibacterales bacterium]
MITMMTKNFFRAGVLALAFAPLMLAACTEDKVEPVSQAGPCATGTVLCPSTNTCAPDTASCPTVAALSAPTALTFARQTPGMGEFAWQAVAGATGYVVYVDGAEAASTSLTKVALAIGAGDVNVQVAAKNDTTTSAKSGSFPVLFDVAVRACGSDNAEVRWATHALTDTALSIEQPSQKTISCVDPTPRTSHLLGDMASCSEPRLKAGTGGRLAPGATMTLNMLSRDSQGFLGSVKQSFTMPGESCLCVGSSKARPGEVCDYSQPNPMTGEPSTLPPCAVGFDLEAGALTTDTSKADIFLEATENANGALTETRLVAPGGVTVLKGKAICDITEAPSTGYVEKLVIGTGDATRSHEIFAERTDSFV